MITITVLTNLEETVGADPNEIWTVAPHIEPIINDNDHAVSFWEESLEFGNLGVVVKTLVT